jgi:hypothetical protein
MISLTTAVRRAALGLALTAVAAQAQSRLVTVTITNLAAPNSISFAPLHLGFHRGVFDAFNNGATAGEGIISVAEGGAGGRWQSDFAAADPTATRGTIAGPLLPGQTRSQSFIVNPTINQWFTFASMVIPSNDFFIGNDDPRRYRLFNDAGDLLLTSINQTASQIWDAGSELFSIEGAAFLRRGTNALRTPQNGVVNFNFTELMGFNGEETNGGYIFNSGLTASQNIFRIDFTSTVVPEPSTYVLFGSGLMFLGVIARRKRTQSV